MTAIKAFVGHSFNETDKPVISAFLKYFDQVSNAVPNFQWVSAQAAEPKLLAQKVQELIADRNTFIGICTCKERVISSDKIHTPYFRKNTLSAASSDFEWKASDWVIQEIGLAIGCNLSLILLLENGCRKPGGLQGDVEFIPFDREYPERAFGPLLEMVRSLSPSIRSEENASTEGPQQSLADSPQPPDQIDDDTPTDEWTGEKYSNAFIWKLIRKDTDGAEKISAAYLESKEGQDAIKQAEWHANTESWRMLMGTGGSIDRIRKLADEFPNSAKIKSDLAVSLGRLGNHVEAAEMYAMVAENLEHDAIKSEAIYGSAAVEFARAGDFGRARAIIERQRNFIVTHPDQERSFLSNLQTIAEVEKDDWLAIEIMERIVQIKPDDFDTRFSLAYQHSEIGNKDIAFHHYLQIPVNRRSSAGWNNLGVSFEHFSMPANSVRAYKTSAEEGETLAMSNLGYKLMNAGFVTEAEQEFNKALAVENFHRNVGGGIAAVRDIFNNEEKVQTETLDKASSKIAFFIRLGKAISAATDFNLNGNWTGPDCHLAVTLNGDEFLALGEYERPGNGLASGLLAIKATTYSVEYKGRVVGRRIYGDYSKKPAGEQNPSTILGALGRTDAENKFVAILDDELTLSVMEDPKVAVPRFYKITRST